MSDLIPAMENALASLSTGKALQPLRTTMRVADRDATFRCMPAYAKDYLGAKLGTFFPHNEQLPTHHSVIALFDPNTGEPLVVMDGRLITEMRTAAVSAVATKALARTDASVLAILGTGVQAQGHLQALRLVRNFREVRVWSPRNARKFARTFGVRATQTAEDAVREADVIVVATTARMPILRGKWLARGAHINAVGAVRPEWRELDDELLALATLYVDSREAASRESGDVIAHGRIVAEIGEVLIGSKMGRQSDDQLTLFKSVGVAVQDLAAADLVFRRVLSAASTSTSDA